MAVLAAACTSAEREAEAPAAPEAAVSIVAEIETPRYLSDRRMIEIVLRNEAVEALRIEGLRLDAGFLSPMDTTVRSVEVPPGRRVDVPVPYGEATCGSDGADAAVVLDVVGVPSPVRVPVTSHDVVQRLRHAECRRVEVAQAAFVGFGNRWVAVGTPGGGAVEGTLKVRRKSSDQRIIVAAVEGNVIFTVVELRRSPGPLLVLESGQLEASTPIRVRATRCEPHALAESKKTFRFPAWVALGGEAAQYLELEVTGRGRQLLQDNLDECSLRYRATR